MHTPISIYQAKLCSLQYFNDSIFISGLRKLSLIGLDGMPKLTDTLFRLVLSHMRLSHLILSSGDPITTLTVDGVRSLLNGPFAESIAKFPFKNWSIASCSKEEFLQLSKEFRSSDML